jgi:hypothetical protein
VPFNRPDQRQPDPLFTVHGRRRLQTPSPMPVLGHAWERLSAPRLALAFICWNGLCRSLRSCAIRDGTIHHCRRWDPPARYNRHGTNMTC